MAGAIKQELWAKEAMENLYPHFEKLKLGCTDDNAYLEGATVHIPSSSAMGTITKNPVSWPLTVEQGTDTKVDYDIDQWSLSPQLITQKDMKQASYDYMQAKVKDATQGVPNTVAINIMINWFTDATYAVTTTGGNFTGHATGATGNRKGLTSADILLARKKLKLQNIDEDIYCYCDEEMFSQLLTDLGLTSSRDFSRVYNEVTGEIIGLHGVKFITYPQIVYLTSANVARAYGNAGATTDNACALMVAKSAVSMAMESPSVIINDNAPGYSGSTLIESTLLAGGKYRRYDKKGVIPIIQAT